MLILCVIVTIILLAVIPLFSFELTNIVLDIELDTGLLMRQKIMSIIRDFGKSFLQNYRQKFQVRWNRYENSVKNALKLLRHPHSCLRSIHRLVGKEYDISTLLVD